VSMCALDVAVEGFFAKLTNRRLKRDVFKNVAQDRIEKMRSSHKHSVLEGVLQPKQK
jgi:hypothetical protein